MKKIICMGILVLMTLLCAVSAQAAGEAENTGTQGVITPRFTYISFLNAGLSINSSGKAICIGHGSAYDNSHTTRLTVQFPPAAAGVQLGLGLHHRAERLLLG